VSNKTTVLILNAAYRDDMAGLMTTPVRCLPSDKSSGQR